MNFLWYSKVVSLSKFAYTPYREWVTNASEDKHTRMFGNIFNPCPHFSTNSN